MIKFLNYLLNTFTPWGESDPRQVAQPYTPQITEGMVKKGGLNKKPKTPRPSPPKGQGPTGPPPPFTPSPPLSRKDQLEERRVVALEKMAEALAMKSPSDEEDFTG